MFSEWKAGRKNMRGKSLRTRFTCLQMVLHISQNFLYPIVLLCFEIMLTLKIFKNIETFKSIGSFISKDFFKTN